MTPSTRLRTKRLCLVLEASGFPDAQVMTGGESRIDSPPDSVDRVDGTVYAEALRQAD
jgi:hypothetical protein